MYWPFENIDPGELMVRAREARARAYVPYSRFPVGAALLTDHGKVIQGCNVENASFGLTICAERTAIGCARVSDAGVPLALAIAGRPGESCLPCGACRQVMAEFNSDMVVLLEEGDGLVSWKLQELLPHRFALDAERSISPDA